MKKLLTTIVFILSFTVFANASAIEEIDINSKIKLAKQQNKHLMIFFHIPGCPYCKSMLDNNFKDKETVEEMKKNFVFINLYTADDTFITFDDFDGDIKEFATHIGAFAYPATIFIDKNKKTVYKSIGYRNTLELLSELNYISSLSYNTVSIKKFTESWSFERED